jgi:drug/metabolite transporter superfamily protein YnfA
MPKLGESVVVWIIFFTAAALEVGGDATVRRGLRGSGAAWIAGGCIMLAVYGLVVNIVRWDFSKLLGVYVAVFTLTSLLVGRFVLREDVAPTTWIGAGIIMAGGLLIQFGSA